MTDTDGKKPLGLGGAPRSGQVKQSFSHGRTKSVVVEIKRQPRVVTPTKPGTPGAAGTAKPSHLGDPSKRPAGISDAEMERRLTALRAAKARELEDTARRAVEDKAREEFEKTLPPAEKRRLAATKDIAPTGFIGRIREHIDSRMKQAEKFRAEQERLKRVGKGGKSGKGGK